MLITEKFFNVRTSLFPTGMDTLPMHVLLCDFPKQNKKQSIVHISIEVQSNLPQVCPVLAMDYYLKICRPTQGPLFQFRSGSPVTHKFVSTNLANILEFNGIKKSQFPHWRCNSFGKPRFLRNLY